MNRNAGRLLVLAALLVLPSAAFAQKEPPHTKETKNAERFIGLAMTRNDVAQRRQYLEQALPPLREAMQKDPGNARVWFMAGSVHAGIGNYLAADSAFDRAVELYPGYGEAIMTERHAAWEQAFNDAVVLINEQKPDQGVVALETAEALFEHRPEAKYYLGLFYLQREEIDKAERVLNAAIAAVNGPIRPQLQVATAAEWDKLAMNAKLRLSNLDGFRGAKLYDAGKYDSAAVVFSRARAASPHSRDHLFNLLQSVYAQSLDLDKQRASAKTPALNQRAVELYTRVVALTDTLRTIDPRNEDIYFFSSRAHKVLSELAPAAAAKTRHMEALRAVNTEYEQLPFIVADVQISETDSSATVSGVIRNKTLKSGATGTVTFELLGPDGKPIGSGPVTVTVPASAAAGAAPDAARIPFKVTIPTSAPIASWRYTVK